MPTIVLTGGGTAGHIMPNIALLPYLREHFDRIIYIGSETGPERELLSPYPEVKFYPITTVKLLRSLSPKNLLIPYRLHKGKKQAKEILLDTAPDIIFSKGGYVALPVTLAGKALKIPMVCHESDLSIGLANRLTHKHFCAVCTTFRETADMLNNGVYVGSPYQKKEISESQKNRIRQQLNLNSTKPICLVFGGSQGAKTINDLVTRNLSQLTRTHQIVHITGKGKLDPKVKQQDYHALEFTRDLATLMSISDIAITRGGSNAIYELLSYNVPMLIIPLKQGSRGDQVQNALYFERKGYALTLLDQEITDESFLSKFEQLQKIAPTMRASTRHAVPTDSLNKITAILLKYKK